MYMCTYFCEIMYKFMNQPAQSRYTILLGEQRFLMLSYYNQEHPLSCHLDSHTIAITNLCIFLIMWHFQMLYKCNQYITFWDMLFLILSLHILP